MQPNPDGPIPTLSAPPSGVTVRMYNPGFGDCLLLAFRAGDGSPRYLLIDCGSHHRYPDRAVLLQKVARDIGLATGNHLHFVAATHEHTDHLDGFRLASQDFDPIQIDTLWLAWTEDPDDPTARQLREHYDKQVKALFGAVNQLRAAGHPGADATVRVLEFEYGPALGANGGAQAPIPYLRGKAKNPPRASADYLRPGQPPLALPDVPGVKIYVFGPPVSPAMIRVLERNNELYPELADANEAAAFGSAVMAAEAGDTLSAEEKDAIQRSHPFEAANEIAIRDLAQSPYRQFFEEHYGFGKDDPVLLNWRRIDSDWLGASENLALSINSYTNNTSLVLAVELAASPQRKVLVFAADAQTGNWLSWQDLSWPNAGPDGTPVTAKDLLARTVLYKVGHHGSRNATLSQKGLEEMVSRDLVAMIPVDEKWAHDVMNWEHPAKSVLERLEQKTAGRVIRTDRIPAPGAALSQLAGLSAQEWESFQANVAWDPSPDRLWIQFTIPE